MEDKVRIFTASGSGERRACIELSRFEEPNLWKLLRTGKRKASRETVRYSFHINDLEDLVLTFPFADRSYKVDKELGFTSDRETDLESDFETPELKIELFPHQRVASERLVAHRNFLLWDAMGLGKTISVLGAIAHLHAVPSLVICPNNAKWLTWQRHIERYTDLSWVVVDGSPNARREAIESGADLTIINYEALRLHPELSEQSYRRVIADEGHRFGNPDAQQTKAFLALRAKGFWILSGTPILSRVTQLWPILHRISPQKYPDYWMFYRWLTITADQEKTRRVIAYKANSMRKLRSVILDPNLSLRRRKEQVLRGLPPVLENVLTVDLTSEQRRLYDRIRAEFKLELANGTVKTLKDARVRITRLKQACFSPELYGGSSKSAKISELKEVVAELSGSGHKALIYSQWARATRIIQRELDDYNPAYVDGSVTGKKRIAQVDRFNEDSNCRIYIGTIGANRESITLGEATFVIFTDEDWTPAFNDQARDRSASGGIRGLGKSVVNVVKLFAHNTIEEKLSEMLRQKEQTFTMMVGERKEVESRSLTLSTIRDLL